LYSKFYYSVLRDHAVDTDSPGTHNQIIAARLLQVLVSIEINVSRITRAFPDLD